MQYVFLAMMCVFAGTYAVIKFQDGLINRLFFKSAASVMFVLIAVSSRTGTFETYYILILIGLCLSLAGDVLLVFKKSGDQLFIAGLICFFLAHIFYIVAFFTVAAFSLIDIGFYAVLLTVGGMAFQYRKLRFGKLKIHIYAYMAVLCAMAAKGLSVLFVSDTRLVYAVFGAIGAVLFALSDLALAYEMFQPAKQHVFGRLNTIMYYSGQALIALSVLI